MKKLLFKLKRLIKTLSIALISTACIYGVTGLTPVNAGVFTGLDTEVCMADAYLLKPGNKLAQDALNCTANDVEITQVTPVNAEEECSLGETFTFPADVTVRTNANERWDTTFYLPLTELSPQVVHGPNKQDCSIILPIPDDSGELADVDLDDDACGDITKANGPDEYVLNNVPITMICLDADNDNRADFNYCAAWDNIERDNCSAEADPYPGQIPNNKSKCNCDTFNIDVFIKPNPPTVLKTLTSTNTRTEPGGTYNFTASFTNPNSNTSIFLTSLSDEIDIFSDDSYNVSLDLWGATTVVNAATANGVYLIATNCAQPPDLGNGLGEIVASDTYSCIFTVHIVDSDLPDDQSPELYDDVIQLSLVDKNNDPVTNGETCPAALAGTPGNFCSNLKQVQVTNLPPTITVVKTANPTQVPESGANVTYTVRVNNTSAAYDSPMQLTSLEDNMFGNLAGEGDCATGGSIAFNDFYQCSFTKFISAAGAGSHTNTATAKAIDNEAGEATNANSATVQINDIPSAIELSKTANPTSVLETGDDPSISRSVNYTFLFSVKTTVGGDTAVDTVTFSSLTDDIFGSLTAGCMVTMKNGAAHGPVALLGFTLDPGENASCIIQKQLRGDNGDTHTNEATIDGTDEDGQAVQAMNSATVTFTPSAPASDMAFATSMLVVLEMHNAGIKDLTLTALSVLNNSVVNDADYGSFVIRNAVGGFHANVFYPACNITEVLGYNGSGTDTYSCAFTIELKPGIENATDINFLSQGVLNGITATLTDGDGDGQSDKNSVSIQVVTDEP